MTPESERRMTPPTLTAEQLSELERLHAEATPGPFTLAGDADGGMRSLQGEGVAKWMGDLFTESPPDRANADLVVEMLNNAPALLAAARERDRLREALERIERVESCCSRMRFDVPEDSIKARIPYCPDHGRTKREAAFVAHEALSSIKAGGS